MPERGRPTAYKPAEMIAAIKEAEKAHEEACRTDKGNPFSFLNGAVRQANQRISELITEADRMVVNYRG